MKKLLILALSIWFSNGYSQQGGMWIPSLLKGQNEKEMKNLGMKISILPLLCRAFYPGST